MSAPQPPAAAPVPPASAADPPADDRGTRAVLSTFSYLWAIAVFFHVASYGLWDEARLEILAATWVLVRPGSTLALATLTVLQIGAVLPIEPRTPNHELFAALIAAGLLVSLAALAIRDRRLAVDRARLFEAFAPAARLALIALYFFAVFHKLNADWFDPDVSCGPVFYREQRDVLPFLPASDTFATGSIHLSLAFEAAIPLLLAFRRTRHLGILAGAAFHGLLAANPRGGFFNFSSMLFAMFALFAAPALIARAADWLGHRRVRAASWAVAGAFALYAFVGQPYFSDWLWPTRDLGRLAFYVYGASLTGLFVAILLRHGTRHDGPRLFRLPQPVVAVLPIVVFLNGMAPHLGLQTVATWAMFSNLRTEGGRSNHLLVPARFQVFDYQGDLVRIVRSSDPYLHRLRQRFIPYYEVRRRPDASITYIRRGVTHSFKRAADDPAFRKVPRLAAPLVVFRPVDRRPKQPCIH